MVKLIESSQFADVPEIGAKFAEYNSPAMSKEAETIFGRSYDSLKPSDDKYVGIHLVALGDEEHYGFNRNADGFSKESCIRDHDTFVKHGHVFSHHHNDAEHDEILGQIKASAYNEKMGRIELFIWADKEKAKEGLDTLEKTGECAFSMATRVPFDECFPKGTLVLTDHGYVPIDEIRVGDRVVSAEGNIRQVDTTAVREANRLTRVSVSDLPLDIECTPNHPFFVVSERKMRGCRGSVGGKKRRHTFRGSTVCSTCHKAVDVSADWVHAGDLHEGDYIKVAVPPCAPRSTVGESFAYLAGQYVGDGCFLTECRGHDGDGDKRIMGISISLSSDERERGIVERAMCAFSRVSGKDAKCYQESGGKHAYRISMYDQLVANRLCSLFGAGSRTKFIHTTVERWSAVEKAAFLGGLIDSDGCVTEDKHAVRIVTVNRGLALSVQRLCWSLGIPATCYLAQRSGASRGGTFCSDGPVYGVQFSEFVDDLFRFSDKLSRHSAIRDSRTVGATILLADGYAYMRVTSSSSFDSDGIAVYNLEVEEDHTYNAEGASVHNCSYCGARRKNSADPNMCDHIRYQLGKIAEDGRAIYMRNVVNDWFDISFVTRPADRIAWSLKVAGEQSDGIVTSEALAKAAGIVEPEHILPGLFSEKFSVIRKLAEAYDEHACHTDTTSRLSPVTKVADERIDDATIDTLRRMPIKEAMAFLCDREAFLGPDAFCRYAMGPKSAEYAEVGPRAAEVGRITAQIIKEAAWYDRFDIAHGTDFDIDRFTTRASRRFTDVALADVAVKSASFGEDNVMDLVAASDYVSKKSEKTGEDHIDGNRDLWLNTVDKPILAVALKYAEYKVAALNAAFSGASQSGASNTNTREALLALVAAQDL